jgi:hypothetical protein
MGRGQSTILAALAAKGQAIKVFLDDDLEWRPTPEGWVRTTTAHETISLLETGNVVSLSLDHDLGDDEKFGTGYTVVYWLAEQSEAYSRNLWPAHIDLHTANSVGGTSMAAVIKRYSDLTEHRGWVWER